MSQAAPYPNFYIPENLRKYFLSVMRMTETLINNAICQRDVQESNLIFCRAYLNDLNLTIRQGENPYKWINQRNPESLLYIDSATMSQQLASISQSIDTLVEILSMVERRMPISFEVARNCMKDIMSLA